jgi:hypothetical protein
VLEVVKQINDSQEKSNTPERNLENMKEEGKRGLSRRLERVKARQDKREKKQTGGDSNGTN